MNLYQKIKSRKQPTVFFFHTPKILQTGSKTAVTPRFQYGGYSFDDFKLYVAGNDVAINSVSVKNTLHKIVYSTTRSYKSV